MKYHKMQQSKFSLPVIATDATSEILHYGVETVIDFSYLGDIINSEGACDAAVTPRTRLGWAKFGECHDLLCGKKFPPEIKGIVCKSCVRSAMLHGSETWCLGQN